ncbi:MAG: hypothetical protein JST84_09220 [Acidobacteria bacterium]|nr:hypothetical protein [Acidobacteriota bacterium]
MQIKNHFAIATVTLALTGALTATAFGQWHPEIDKVKARKANVQSIKSPRDVATGQATGRRKAPRPRPAAQDKLGNFEIQDIKSPRDAASGQATGITSPRDVASGQATGKRQHKPITKRPGFMDYTDDSAMPNVVAGQNSGGTITNQRRKQSGPKGKAYLDGGVTHEDTWDQQARKPVARKRK